MGLEVESLTGAPHGERSTGRINLCYGYRDRVWETRPTGRAHRLKAHGTVERPHPQAASRQLPSGLSEATPLGRERKALAAIVQEAGARPP